MEAEKRAKLSRVAITVGGGLTFVGIIVLGLWLSDDGRRQERLDKLKQVTTTFETPTVDPAKVWISQSESEIAKLKKRNAELESEIRQIKRRLDKEDRRGAGARPAPDGQSAADPLSPTSALLKAIKQMQDPEGDDKALADLLPKPPADTRGSPEPEESQENALRTLPPPPAPPTTPPPAEKPVAPLIPSPASGQQQAGIMVVELADPNAPGDEEFRTAEDFLPAGSLIRATLLGGVDAPTGGLAKSNPHPVLLRLEDHGTLPNRFRSHVRECHITAAAYGDLPSERTYFRTERLSCVMEDGRILERKITAYVAGEDGKTGLRGHVVEKRGQYIAKTLLAGGLGGLGTAVAQSVTQISTSPLGSVQTLNPQDIGKYGLASGVGTSLQKLADWYLARADELYPVIEIDAGRTIDVVLLVGLKLDAGVDGGSSSLAKTSTGGTR